MPQPGEVHQRFVRGVARRRHLDLRRDRALGVAEGLAVERARLLHLVNVHQLDVPGTNEWSETDELAVDCDKGGTGGAYHCAIVVVVVVVIVISRRAVVGATGIARCNGVSPLQGKHAAVEIAQQRRSKRRRFGPISRGTHAMPFEHSVMRQNAHEKEPSLLDRSGGHRCSRGLL